MLPQITVSSFVNNSSNFFKGKNKSEIFNFTEKSIIAAKEYLTSIGETSSTLRMTLITSLEANFKNLSIDDETINLSSTFGIYKKDGKYYNAEDDTELEKITDETVLQSTKEFIEISNLCIIISTINSRSDCKI